MFVFLRVDDRLLHGQIICAWVPVVRADTLVVASDEAASDTLASDIMCSCAYKGLNVYVLTVKEALEYVCAASNTDERIILIVAEIKDALRLNEGGLQFRSVNIGNVHHDEDGRCITPSVIINAADELILKKLASNGVTIDIRDVPATSPAEFA